MRFPQDVPTLTSGDVTLRAHRPEDAPAVVEQCVDPQSVRWTTVPLGYTLDSAHEFLSQVVPDAWASEREFSFAIESTHPDGVRRFSGTVSLRDEGDRRAEVAFGAHPAIRGCGVMTTAVNLLLDWGFGDRDVETVVWYANVGNIASRRVAWKTGFTFAGTMRRWLNHRGEYDDGWAATLHRDDSREPKTRWASTPVLRGDGVLLRPLAESDAERIVEACTDATTRHFIPFLPSPFGRGDAVGYVHRVIEQQSLGLAAVWAVADPDTDVLLGVAGLPRIGRTVAEVGYWCHPDGRGRGITTASVGIVVRQAFVAEDDGGLGLRRVFLRAASSNAASLAVARRNGFVEVGRERQGERLGDGSYDDLLVFDLLRGEPTR